MELTIPGEEFDQGCEPEKADVGTQRTTVYFTTAWQPMGMRNIILYIVVLMTSLTLPGLHL